MEMPKELKEILNKLKKISNKKTKSDSEICKAMYNGYLRTMKNNQGFADVEATHAQMAFVATIIHVSSTELGIITERQAQDLITTANTVLANIHDIDLKQKGYGLRDLDR